MCTRRIAVHTTEGIVFNLDVDQEYETVASVKQKIEELEPGYQQNLQRIVLGGKILADNAIITDHLVGPKDFPVCILKKSSAQGDRPTAEAIFNSPDAEAAAIPGMPVIPGMSGLLADQLEQIMDIALARRDSSSPACPALSRRTSWGHLGARTPNPANAEEGDVFGSELMEPAVGLAQSLAVETQAHRMSAARGSDDRSRRADPYRDVIRRFVDLTGDDLEEDEEDVVECYRNGHPIDQNDISLLMHQSSCSREEAVRALRQTGGDLHDASRFLEVIPEQRAWQQRRRFVFRADSRGPMSGTWPHDFRYRTTTAPAHPEGRVRSLETEADAGCRSLRAQQPPARASGPRAATQDPMQGAEDVTHTCAQCGRACTNQCSQCRRVAYCDSECQRLHWRTHKRNCVRSNRRRKGRSEPSPARGDGNTTSLAEPSSSPNPHAGEQAGAEGGVDPQDVNLVMQQAYCSRQDAVRALLEHDGDIINAIMELAIE